MRIAYFDTETFLIQPGLLIPKMVCLQYTFDDESPVVLHALEAEGACKRILEAEHIVGANTAYDIAVMLRAFPHLAPLVWRAYDEGRIADVQIREKQLAIARGDFMPKVSLETLSEKYLNLELDKGKDGWRLRYGTLYATPVAQWPERAVAYAHDDVIATRGVFKKQGGLYVSPDERVQAAAGWALHLQAARGFRTDRPRVEALEAALRASQRTLVPKLMEEGLLRYSGPKSDPESEMSKPKAAMQRIVETAYTLRGLPVPRTDKGGVQTDVEALQPIADKHPVLLEYLAFVGNEKLLSTYIDPLKRGFDAPLTSRPNVLVSTGRTSWADPNLQNPPRKGGIRECVIPREGFVLCSVDYNSFELRTLGQICLWWLGRSALADGYKRDPQWDPHCYMASVILGISYEEAVERNKKKDKQVKDARQLSKAANFGFPGGLGSKRFIDYARVGYGVDLTLRESERIRDIWFKAYPEMHDYFEFVDHRVKTGRPIVIPPTGFTRGGVGFTDGCNTGFQGLAAAGMKRAAYAVARACYAEPRSPLAGSFPIMTIHDELVVEVPEGSAHEAAMEIVRLMEQGAAQVCPDVPIVASPALMRRFSKAAEAYHIDGRLAPDPAAEKT